MFYDPYGVLFDGGVLVESWVDLEKKCSLGVILFWWSITDSLKDISHLKVIIFTEL